MVLISRDHARHFRTSGDAQRDPVGEKDLRYLEHHVLTC